MNPESRAVVQLVVAVEALRSQPSQLVQRIAEIVDALSREIRAEIRGGRDMRRLSEREIDLVWFYFFASIGAAALVLCTWWFI